MEPSKSITILRMCIDSAVSMEKQVSRTVKSGFSDVSLGECREKQPMHPSTTLLSHALTIAMQCIVGYQVLRPIGFRWCLTQQRDLFLMLPHHPAAEEIALVEDIMED